MLTRVLLFSSLLVTMMACGSSSDPLERETPEAANETPGATEGSNANGGDPKAPVSTKDVELRVHNKTGAEVRLMKDYQAPLWLEIGDPPYLLNGYGQTWCGNKDYGHNEPAFLEEKIAPGETIKATWRASYVRFDDDASCWRIEIAPKASFPAKACIYEGTNTPGGIARDEKEMHKLPAGPGPHGPPSTWFKNPPSRCIPLTIEVKDGGSTVDVDILPL